jgi:hypothetical protein
MSIHFIHVQFSDKFAALATSNAFTDDFQTLEHTIARFIPTLIPVHQLDATVPDQKHAYIAIHTLAHAAMINLYYPFGAEDPVSYEKCLRAARFCVSIIKHIADSDYEFLDPIIGVSIHNVLHRPTNDVFFFFDAAVLDVRIGHLDSRT